MRTRTFGLFICISISGILLACTGATQVKEATRLAPQTVQVPYPTPEQLATVEIVYPKPDEMEATPTILVVDTPTPAATATPVDYCRTVETKTNKAKYSNYQTRSDREAIKEVIQIYFDIHYQSLCTYHLIDFSPLTAGSRKAKAFLDSESIKMAIEISHAKRYRLGYQNYSIDLHYKDILINTKTLTATAIVSENSDFEYEFAQDFKDDPPHSQERNLMHRIELRKTNGIWGIEMDEYEDILWQYLRAVKTPKEEILKEVLKQENMPPTFDVYQTPTASSAQAAATKQVFIR